MNQSTEICKGFRELVKNIEKIHEIMRNLLIITDKEENFKKKFEKYAVGKEHHVKIVGIEEFLFFVCGELYGETINMIVREKCENYSAIIEYDIGIDEFEISCITIDYNEKVTHEGDDGENISFKLMNKENLGEINKKFTEELIPKIQKKLNEKIRAVNKIKRWWVNKIFWNPNHRVGWSRLMRSYADPEYSVW